MKNIMKVKAFLLVAIVALYLVGCGKKEEVVNADPSAGFNSILFNVNATSIKGGNADSTERLDKRFPNVNLSGGDAIWPGHKMFFMHAMGNISFSEAGNYTFRLASSGKITFRLNNVDLFHSKKPIDTLAAKSRYVEAGKNIFEFEYYDGGLEPKLVLEWSKDGTNFEVIPASAFSVIELADDSVVSGNSDAAVDPATLNTLSDAEKAAGWKLLFDGKSTAGWHRYNKPGTIGKKWIVENGNLTFEGREKDRFRYTIEGRVIEMGNTDKEADGGFDIVTDQSFGDFELQLEWRISKGGNSGIFYTVQELPQYDEAWKTSPEMQVLDDSGHKDGLIYKHRAGDLYDLIACNPVTVKRPGEWNKVKVVKKKGAVEHWLNDVKVVEYDINSPTWKDMIKNSKFSTLQDFATASVNKIGLQDHDNQVSFRNIKIRELK
jgi:hypothetical protein